MKQTKSHFQTFVFEALPILFHNQTQDFIDFLNRDGMNFLQFWWNKIGEKFDETERTDSKGLAYDIKELESGATIVLLTLPSQAKPEVYFMALFQPKQKKTFLKWENFARVFCLVHDMNQDRDNGTMLIEVTPRGKRCSQECY
jgi:hypothetical protein